jgi:predicted ATPase
LARHCTEAGLIEKAVAFWGKAGQRSLERSALVEAVEQLTRALAQIATLPASPVQRREEIRCQVALANALMHTKGYAAPETRAALDQARALIENANALGEPPEDPLLLFSNLYGFWVSNYVAFDGDVIRALARKFLVLAEERGASVPLMIAHRIMGCSLASTGDLVEARVHFDCAVALYDPAAHRPLAARFGQDNRVTSLAYGSVVVWLLGYPDAAYAYAESAVKNARELGQAAALMYSLFHTSLTTIFSGRYEAANARLDELVGLAEEKNAAFWRAGGTTHRGCALAMTGKAADALHMINAEMTAMRSTGATMFSPLYLSYLARACVELGKFDDASHWISEARVAMQTSKESWWEAEIDRIEGELALKSPLDVARAEVYFERALAVARQQQAKSWELRAAMSLARLWRSQGKVRQARELLAPVYGWFTEGFDTRDLKEGKALLKELSS